MRFSWQRALIIARREYLTAVRRKAFLITLIGMPAYFAFVMWISVKPQVEDRAKSIRDLHTLGVVDSSGLLAHAPADIRTTWEPPANPFSTRAMPVPVQTYRATVRIFPDQAAGERALLHDQVDQLLVVPPDYLERGALRRYVHGGGGVLTSADARPITGWLVRGLLAGMVDSARVERVTRPSRGLLTYELGKDGRFTLKDDRRETLSFMLPFLFGMLMSIGILTGGQYLLQGVSEEKESRILESLICTVTAEDLLVGKMIGLGSVGLTLVGAWAAMGSTISGPALAMAKISLPPMLLVLLVLYFLLGYLFYASIMIAIGAMTNNMREAQQLAWAFTFANFVPFLMIWMILSRPNGSVAIALTMIPFTAATAAMLRVVVPGATVPAWQIGLSLLLLAASVVVVLQAAARIFRIGLLMYGKPPTLPEILRWARTK